MRAMLLAGGLLLGASAPAAPLPAPDRPLTLLELSDLALRNHPSTRAAWADVRRSEAAEQIARAAYWPTLSVAYTASRSRQIANEGTSVPAQTRYGPSASLSWLLLDFGTRGGTVDQAAADLLAARLTRDQALQDLLLTVETAYYARIGAQAVEEASRRSLEEAAANAEAARVRHDAGVATIADVYQAQAALASATLTAQQAAGNRIVAEGDLAVAAGYGPEVSLPLVEWHASGDPALPAGSVEQLLQQAREARPELLAAKASEQAADAAVRAARGRWWPTLTVGGSAGQTQVVDRGQTQQYSYNARIDLPIFSGFSTQAALDQAKAARDLASANAEIVQRSVEQAVWTAWQNVRTAHGTLDAARAQLRAAEQAADAIRARYKTGLASILEVLTTESVLASARVTDIQAAVNWEMALATLGHDAGGMKLPDDTTIEETP